MIKHGKNNRFASPTEGLQEISDKRGLVVNFRGDKMHKGYWTRDLCHVLKVIHLTQVRICSVSPLDTHLVWFGFESHSNVTL